MSDFVSKATAKLDKLSPDQIRRIISGQNEQLTLCKSLLDCVDSGLLALDSKLNIIYHNNFFNEIFNCEVCKERTSKIRVDKVIHNVEIIDFIKLNNTNPGKDYLDADLETSILGQVKIRVSAHKIKGSGYTIFRFLDITFFEKMKSEFKKNESLAQMTTMAATVAHEIKNPLASISIYLQLLEKMLEKDGVITREKAEKSISVISSEIERLNTIAVDFLFAVRPMNVNLKLESINDCVKKTINIAEPEIEEAGIVLESDLGSGLPKTNIDFHLMEQCILNLLRNAVQAMTDEKKDKKIRINTFLDGDSVKLSVSDTGCGMSQEEIAKIFEPYYTTKAQGSGLGLTTIFKIMKEHKGEITVTSQQGEGAVFTLILPVPKSERFRLGQK